jgi:hypothetical protein
MTDPCPGCNQNLNEIAILEVFWLTAEPCSSSDWPLIRRCNRYAKAARWPGLCSTEKCSPQRSQGAAAISRCCRELQRRDLTGQRRPQQISATVAVHCCGSCARRPLQIGALQISAHDPLSQSMLMDASLGSGITAVSVKTTSVPAATSSRNGASLAAGPTGPAVPSNVALTLAGYSSSKRKRGMLSASLALRAHVLDQYFAGIEVEPDSLASHL